MDPIPGPWWTILVPLRPHLIRAEGDGPNGQGPCRRGGTCGVVGTVVLPVVLAGRLLTEMVWAWEGPLSLAKGMGTERPWHHEPDRGTPASRRLETVARALGRPGHGSKRQRAHATKGIVGRGGEIALADAALPSEFTGRKQVDVMNCGVGDVGRATAIAARA